MSGVAHAVGKVFKGIGHLIKKIWKPLLIAVAVYFTAGAALAYFGAAGAAGGAAAFAGSTAAVEGGVAAGAVAGAAGGAAAAAGEFAATDALTAAAAGSEAGFGAGVAADLGGSAAGLGADAATGAVADLGGAGVLAGGDAAATAAGSVGDSGLLSSAATPEAGAGPTAANGGINMPGVGGSGLGDGTAGQTSSWWQASLDTAGKVMKVPGMTSLLSQGINGYMQADMYNQNLKWMEEHAPGQIAGGVKGAFSQQAMNQNLAAAATPTGHGQVAPVTTTHEFTPNTPGVGGITTDPRNLPGMNSASAPSSGLSGYGMPGYGQQQPRNPYQAQQQQQGILGGSEMPYVDSPYDQSVV